METVFYKTDWFKAMMVIAMLCSVLSIIVNYKIIRAKKPNNSGFVWSTLLWGFLGYVFPIISCLVLYLITRDDVKQNN